MQPFDCMIGDIRVTRIEEGVRPSSRPSRWFLDYNADEFAPLMKWLVPGFYAPELGQVISSVHTWVLRMPSGKVILIDTCTGNHKDRPEWDVFHMLDTPYLERLRAAGVAPEDVDIVFCTHLHVDHVGWNTRLEDGRWVPTFPNARYLISKPDFEHFTRAVKLPTTTQMTRNTFADSVLPIVEAGLATFIEGTEEIDHGLQLSPAPGHTPGQARLDLRSGGRMACFCGDVLHHPLQVPLWHWRARVDVDPDLGRQTRRQLLEHCVETGSLLLPAHFAHPHGAYINADGGTFSLEWPVQPGAPRKSHPGAGAKRA